MSRFEGAHRFFSKYLLLAQCSGSFPVCGITSLHHNKLKFKWHSFRTCYAWLVIGLSIFSSLLDVHQWIFDSSRLNLVEISKREPIYDSKVDLIFLTSAPTCFRFISALLNILLFRLAMQWHKIMAKWCKVDALTFATNPSENVSKKIRTISVILFIFQASKENIL